MEMPEPPQAAHSDEEHVVQIIFQEDGQNFEMNIRKTTPVEVIKKRVADNFDIPVQKVSLVQKQVMTTGRVGDYYRATGVLVVERMP